MQAYFTIYFYEDYEESKSIKSKVMGFREANQEYPATNSKGK